MMLRLKGKVVLESWKLMRMGFSLGGGQGATYHVMKRMRAKLSLSLLKRQGDRTEIRYTRLGLITGSVMRVGGGDCPVGWQWYSLGEERWASSGGEAG